MNHSRIFTIERFLSSSESASLADLCEGIGFENQYSGEGLLIRSRAQFEDHYWAKLIWERLQSALPRLTDVYTNGFSPEPAPPYPLHLYSPVQLNERFRCYKYGPGEEFRRHQDIAFEYSKTKRTFFTVLIYLNDGYAGGETTFDDCIVTPNLGMLVMFPHELEHAGQKIVSGLKYTIRTDVVYEAFAG
ncbi:MAG: 2OG-Fe(II) oxygenase [Zavarzinella sp.]